MNNYTYTYSFIILCHEIHVVSMQTKIAEADLTT